MSKKPKQIGLMGCGAVADYGHIPAIQRTEGLQLHALYDPNADALAYMQMETISGATEFKYYPEKSFSGMYLEWAQALDSGQSELLTIAEDGMRVIEIAREATNDAIKRRKG